MIDGPGAGERHVQRDQEPRCRPAGRAARARRRQQRPRQRRQQRDVLPADRQHVREPGVLEVLAHARPGCPRRRPAPCRVRAPPIGGGSPALTPRSARRRTASSDPCSAAAAMPGGHDPIGVQHRADARAPQVGRVVEAAAAGAPAARAGRPPAPRRRSRRARATLRGTAPARVPRRHPAGLAAPTGTPSPRAAPGARRARRGSRRIDVAGQLDVASDLADEPRLVDLREARRTGKRPGRHERGQPDHGERRARGVSASRSPPPRRPRSGRRPRRGRRARTRSQAPRGRHAADGGQGCPRARAHTCRSPRRGILRGVSSEDQIELVRRFHEGWRRGGPGRGARLHPSRDGVRLVRIAERPFRGVYRGHERHA